MTVMPIFSTSNGGLCGSRMVDFSIGEEENSTTKHGSIMVECNISYA